ncbi:MAG: EF-hand domain-containing protein [Puniceicoccaceae bacterium]
MKKIITLITCTLFAFSAQAEWDMFKAHDLDKDGEVSKEEWTTKRQKVADNKGKKYNEKQAMKTFKKADTDDSGTLSQEEVEALQASWKKNKK